MTLALLLAFAGYAFVTSITPGPNNTLLLAPGAQYGFRPTLPLLLGINLGIAALVLAVGLGLGAVFVAFPLLHELLRCGGVAYLLYLAWKIASSEAWSDSAERRPITFLQAAAFQWVNPKAWIIAIGAMATYAPSDEFFRNVLIVTAVFCPRERTMHCGMGGVRRLLGRLPPCVRQSTRLQHRDGAPTGRVALSDPRTLNLGSHRG